MRVCVPTFKPAGLEARVCEHFGRCEAFTVAEIDDKGISRSWSVSNKKAGQHNCALTLQRIVKEGIDLIIVGKIGRGPFMGLSQLGVKVYVGARGSVEETLEEYIKSNLRPAIEEDICRKKCHK
jgi:predicted Fe-Mo cluster-binding NifX family protein